MHRIKIILKVFCIFSLLFILNIQLLFSQRDKQQTVFVGQLNRYDSIPSQQLEKAKLRIWYEYSYIVEYEKEIVLRKDTMALVIGNNYSVYYDWHRESRYKSMLSQLDDARKITKNITYSPFHAFSELAVDDKRLSEFTLNRENSQILKNRTQNLITITDLDDSDIVSEKLYLLEEKISPQEWQMEEGTKMLLEYECQKATCHFKGRDYTAWFTLDIPINDGPYKFYGLPGLILMVEDSEGMFRFKAVGLEQLTNVEIVSDNKKDFIVCTPEQYRVVKKRIQETNVLYYSQGETLYVTKRRIPVNYKVIEKE